MSAIPEATGPRPPLPRGVRYLVESNQRGDHGAGTAPRVRAAPGPVFEAFEQRILLSITLSGLPDWLDVGSKPIINAGSVSDPNSPAGGGVEDVAIHPTIPAIMYAGTINGGIWKTTNGNRPFNGIDDDGVNGVDDAAEQPDWYTLTDHYA